MSLPIGTPENGPAATGSASLSAYEKISEAILVGTFQEGQFLDEAGLARAVGTSRTPVREALRRLHAERYVDLVPRRGAQVRVITATEMQEIYETRLIVETAALKRICDQRRSAPPAARSVLVAMEEAGERQDWFTFARYDQHFHHLIVKHAGNAVLADLHQALRPRQIRLAVRTISEAPQRRRTIEQEHRQLVAAMEANDGGTAVRILGEHLRAMPELLRAFSG